MNNHSRPGSKKPGEENKSQKPGDRRKAASDKTDLNTRKTSGQKNRTPAPRHAQDNRTEGRSQAQTGGKKTFPKTPAQASKDRRKAPAAADAPAPKKAPVSPSSRPGQRRKPPVQEEPVFNKAAFQDNQDPGSIHGAMENGAVIGRSAVRELLKGGRTIDKIYVQRGPREGSIVMLMGEANTRGIPVIEVDKARLDAMAGFVPHQGIIAMAAEKDYCTPSEILAAASKKNEAPLVVICDNISDPYNLGAIIRCADGAGAHGVIIPKRHSTGLTPLVTRASAGALEHMPVAKVTNIAQTVSDLQKSGVWVYAAEAGGTPYDQVDLTGSVAIVLGSEGDGVTNLVKKTCDGIISIPMYGQVNSFNVSTAAAVLLCEAGRQRHKAKDKTGKKA